MTAVRICYIIWCFLCVISLSAEAQKGKYFEKNVRFSGEGYTGGESGDGSKTGPDKAAISLAAVGIDSFHPFWNKHVYRERTR